MDVVVTVVTVRVVTVEDSKERRVELQENLPHLCECTRTGSGGMVKLTAYSNRGGLGRGRGAAPPS